MSLESKRKFLEREEYGPDPLKCTINAVTYHGNHHIQVPFITEVAHNLWQGGCEEGLVLPDFFEHVVSLYPWEKYTVNHMLHSNLEVAVFDDASFDKEVIDQIAAWTASRILDGPTLVHCQMGINRSSMVIVRALQMLLLGRDGTGDMSADEAIKLVRDKRSPYCLCNSAMEEALRSW